MTADTPTTNPKSTKRFFMPPSHPDVNPQLIRALYDHGYAITQMSDNPSDLLKIMGNFDIKAEDLYPSGSNQTAHDTAKGATDYLSGVLKKPHSDVNIDALRLYGILIQSPSNGSLNNAGITGNKISQHVNKFFADSKNIQYVQGVFRRLEEYGLMEMFEHFLECKGDHKTSLSKTPIQTKLANWRKLKTRQADVAVSAENSKTRLGTTEEGQDAAPAAEPAAKSTDVNTDLIAKLRNHHDSFNPHTGYQIGLPTICKEFDLEPTNMVTQEVIKTGYTPTPRKERIQTDRSRLITHPSSSANQDALNVYHSLISEREKVSLFSARTRMDDQRITSLSITMLRRIYRQVFHGVSLTNLHGLFDRIERYGLMDLFEEGLNAKGHDASFVPKSLKPKLAKWKEAQEQRNESSPPADFKSGKIDVAVAIPAEFRDRLISFINQGRTIHHSKMQTLWEEFDGLSNKYGFQSYVMPQTLTASADPMAIIRKIHGDLMDGVTDPLQDAHLIVQEAILTTTRNENVNSYHAIPMVAQKFTDAEAHVEHVRNRNRGRFEALPLKKIHNLFSRMHKYGLLDAFEDYVRDQDNTTLPKSLIATLESWKKNKMLTVGVSDLDDSVEVDASPIDVADIIAEKQKYFDTEPRMNLAKSFSIILGIDPKEFRKQIDDINVVISESKLTTVLRQSWRFIGQQKWKEEFKKFHCIVFLSGAKKAAVSDNDSNTTIEHIYPHGEKEDFWTVPFSRDDTSEYLFETARRYDFLPELYFFSQAEGTYFPEGVADRLKAWCEKQGIDLTQLLVDYELPEAVNEHDHDLKAEEVEVAVPTDGQNKETKGEPEPPVNVITDLSLRVIGAADADDIGYVAARRNLMAAARQKRHLRDNFPLVSNLRGILETPPAESKMPYWDAADIPQTEPYEAPNNDERDIPRFYVPNLLPEGNSDHEGGLELTGDFTGASGRRGKRQVTIQEERRDLIVEALKRNPQIDNTKIREYTHPEFDTEEGRYYTVIHAETYDGNWTQIAVSTAKGDGVFLDKHRQIVDPMTGRSRLGISDLREDLLVQRIKYAEDHPENYQARIDEISIMSPDDVPESTKTAIQWEKLRKYGNKVANQIHSSYAEHIRKFGEGVACEDKETSELIIKTGDMRLDPNEEHPSLIYRTRWDRVVSAVREGKVTGLGHLACTDQGNTETARKQVEKGLLQWVVENDPTNELFDCLNENTQEWLCSHDEDMPQQELIDTNDNQGLSSASVTEANTALAGAMPANDDKIEIEGGTYTRAELLRKLQM